MPARTRIIYHTEAVKERIRTTQLLNRLRDNALAEKEFMTSGQIRSAEILLRKVIPDLAAVQHSGEMTVRNANQLTDDELAAIAARGSTDAAAEKDGERELSSVH
jgi:hypothetical protein